MDLSPNSHMYLAFAHVLHVENVHRGVLDTGTNTGAAYSIGICYVWSQNVEIRSKINLRIQKYPGYVAWYQCEHSCWATTKSRLKELQELRQNTLGNESKHNRNVSKHSKQINKQTNNQQRMHTKRNQTTRVQRKITIIYSMSARCLYIHRRYREAIKKILFSTNQPLEKLRIRLCKQVLGVHSKVSVVDPNLVDHLYRSKFIVHS